MSKYLSWYCFDAAFARDPKIDNLPSNHHRWAMVCLLGLEKQNELEGQDVTQFWKQCGSDSYVKFEYILDELRTCGLIGDDNRPIDFSGWQRRALSQERTRRSRNGNATVRKCNTSVRNGNAPVTTHTHTHTDKKKNKKEPSADAQVVFDYLKQVTGKTYRRWEDIEACLKREGCTPAECMAVIDYLWHRAAGDVTQQEWVNSKTPWRPSKFSGNLDLAQAANIKTGLTTKHSGVY